MSKKLISLELSTELINQLKEESRKQELSMSALIRVVLKSYLKNENEKNNTKYGFIYKMTNIVNGKIYIGKTEGSIDKRFKEHKRYSTIYKKSN